MSFSKACSHRPADTHAAMQLIDAGAILLLVPAAERQCLVAEYLGRGGAWPVSGSQESTAFLEFLMPRLPDPSHALSLCRMERAMMRARAGAKRFVEPVYRMIRLNNGSDVRGRIELEAWGCIERALQAYIATETWDHIERNVWESVESAVWDGVEREARGRLECQVWEHLALSTRNRIERGPHASLVWFHAEPASALRALHGGPLPLLGEPRFPVLIGPGVPNLCRAATAAEVELWSGLPADDAAPDLVERLLSEGIVVYTEQDQDLGKRAWAAPA